MEKVSRIDRVKNEEGLQRVKEEGNILVTIKRKKTNWIGHILCRNFSLKYVIDGRIKGKTEVMGRGGRRRKQIPDGLKERKGYWKLKEEVLGCNLWRTRFGRRYRPVVRQTMLRINT